MVYIVKNANSLMVKFDKLKGASEKAVARGTTKAAMMLQKRMRERIMKGPKSGRTYGRHRASAANESPANETGNLQRSIHIVAAKPAPVAEARVVVSADYAKALEYGTKTAGSKHNVIIEPRPFARPSIDELKDAMSKVIADEAANGSKTK